MRRRNQKIGIVSYSSRKEEETLINKIRSSSNHKWEGRASAKKGAWRSFILPTRATNVALSPPIAVGNGFHQQPPFGAGPSAEQFGAPGHYGGAGTNTTSNPMLMSYEEWEQKYGTDLQYWIDLSTVDPRGNLSVHLKDIPQGAKATPTSTATGLHALFELGRSFLCEGASAASFICIRKQLGETECTPKKTMTEAHARSHQMPALSVSDKVRFLQQAGISKIPRRQ